MYQNFQCEAKNVTIIHKQNKIHNAVCPIHSFSTSHKTDTLRKRNYKNLDAENEFGQGFIHGEMSQ